MSGINLPKVEDGVAPLNEPCHSRRLCEGSMWCCVTVGTCVPIGDERGIFVGNSKQSYWEGGCTHRSVNKSHEDYDPDCKQVGECHFPYILQSRGGSSAPFAMTPVPSSVMNRLLAGSTCGAAAEDVSSSPRRHTAWGVATLIGAAVSF